MTQPTPQDIANAERRQAIAERFQRDYVTALGFSCSLFGPDFKPHGYHYLVDSSEADRCRFTSEQPPKAAVVFSSRKGDQERHFVVEDGIAREVPSIEAGFGPLLHEKHPTKRITARGEEVAPARFELCWGWFEPNTRVQSAEQLAAARQKRQERAVEREAAGNLFSEAVRSEGYVKPRRTR